MRRGASLALALLLGTLAAGEGRADPVQDCRSAQQPERRLAACTEVIDGAAFPADQKAIAYRSRGRARTEAGALDTAIADLSEAIRLNAQDSQAYGYRAQARLGRGDTDGAITDLGEMIRIRPAAAGYNARGHAYLVKGEPKLAIADFTRAIELNPQSASALNNRGLAHKAAGDLPRAIDDFTAAIIINPIYALAYNNRGYAHEAQGRIADAIADYRRAVFVDPSLAGAKEALTRLGAAGEHAAESAKLIAEGKDLVERHCGWCHAIDRSGASPNPKAPPFRVVHQRHPMQALREPLTRGIAAPHDEMPKFQLGEAEVDKVIAYINSLGVGR
jgi:tetratricopeptide (TPR) repeat protein